MATDKERFGVNVINMMKAQFGNAAKGYWFYDGDTCPCCNSEIDALVWNGEHAVSINGFMYRKRGIIIAYFLCGDCATAILAHTVYEKTSRHEAIEANLVSAYERHIGSMDA